MITKGTLSETNSSEKLLETTALDVGGMKCAGCLKAVEKQLISTPGVTSAWVNLITEVAVIEYEKEKIEPEILAATLTKTGFKSEVRKKDCGISQTLDRAKQKRQKQQKQQFWQLITAIILLVFSGIGHLHHFGFPHIPIISNIWFHWGLATLALLIPGRSLIVDGGRNLYYGTPNMNTLVGLGTISAYIASCIALWFPQLNWECFFDEPVMLLGFIFLGRTLESLARNKAVEGLEKLVNLQPQYGRLLDREGNLIKIPVEQVKVGECLQVLPGEKIPVDGIILKGKTTIDESMLTGESIGVLKSSGDLVFTGTINLDNIIDLRVKAIGSDTNLGKIINIVESAQTRKAPIQKLADTVAGYFAYGVIGIALLTWGFWYFIGTNIWSDVIVTTSPLLLSLKLSIAVLVISCPCALGLATPTAIVVGTSIAASNGILIKGGDILEKIHQLTTIVFDKTGTLTSGKLKVTDCLSYGNLSSQELLVIAASIEKYSNHPLSSAITNSAREQELSLLSATDIKIESGWGISGTIDGQKFLLGNQEFLAANNVSFNLINKIEIKSLLKAGKTIVFIAQENKSIGLIALKDSLRPNTKGSVSQLQNMGLKTILLTGDREEIARQVAEELSIKEIFAKVKPDGKAEIIQSLNNNEVTAMIGDGINDAPALAIANIGISLKGATDIAVDTADLILMQNNLADLVRAIKLSKATVKTIQQNLFWALAYNAIAIPLAAGFALPKFGLILSPGIAGLAMASSSLIVVMNSLLLGRNLKDLA